LKEESSSMKKSYESEVENNAKLVLERERLEKDVECKIEEMQVLNEGLISWKASADMANIALDEMKQSYDAAVEKTTALEDELFKLQSDYNMLEREQDTKSEEIERLEEELESVRRTREELEAQVASHEKKAKILEDAISSEEARHLFRVKELEDELHRVTSLCDAESNKVEELNEEVTRMQESSGTSAEGFEARIWELRESHESEVSLLKLELEKGEDNLESELKSAREGHVAEVESLENNAREIDFKLTSELEKNSMLFQECETLKLELASESDETGDINPTQEAVEELKVSHEAKIQELQAVDEELNMVRVDYGVLKGELEVATMEHERLEEDIKNAHASNEILDGELAISKGELRALEEELCAMAEDHFVKVKELEYELSLTKSSYNAATDQVLNDFEETLETSRTTHDGLKAEMEKLQTTYGSEVGQLKTIMSSVTTDHQVKLRATKNTYVKEINSLKEDVRIMKLSLTQEKQKNAKLAEDRKKFQRAIASRDHKRLAKEKMNEKTKKMFRVERLLATHFTGR